MSSTTEDKVRHLPCWSGTPKLERLSGGVSNESFAVTDAKGRWVARVGVDYPFHHVFRDRELIVSRAAHAAGLSPEILYGEGNAIVLRFIEGKTFGESDVRANREACVDLLRTCHRVVAQHVTGPGAIFWVFHVLRDYCHALVREGHPFAQRAPAWFAVANEMEAEQEPLPIVFGHHDLLPMNFIDDGRRLWLIDWEYGAFGTAMFDLANLAANNSFGPDEERDALERYFERPVDARLERSYDAMKVASALREALWGLISEVYLKTPGIDYRQYAENQFTRYDAVLAAYRQKHG